MAGVVVIVLVLLLIPVLVLMAGAVGAALFGGMLTSDAEASHPDSELTALNV